MDRKSFEALLDGYLQNNLSKQELSRFLDVIRNNKNAETVQQAIERLLLNTPSASAEDPGKADVLYTNIMVAAQQNLPLNEATVIDIKQPKKLLWLKWAAVASLLGAVILSVVLSSSKKEIPAVAKIKQEIKPYKNDVLPGGEKAILKLSDGSSIVLDDAQNGALAHQGNTDIIKVNGRINYSTNGTSSEVMYNTITTPKGGKYQVQLPDGSEVWLNSGSSLYFPTAFIGKERRVELSGQAYFEVAKNRQMPFIVKVKKAEIQVLGTHFDVMAYNDENTIKTSLLEGSVKFVSGHNQRVLKPGQQSQLSTDGQVKVLNNINAEEVLSWKSGVFHFNNADVETVMRQLSRWYDVDVIYKSKPTERFFAKIPTNTKLSDVLMALELTGKVHFQIDGRKVIVMP